MGKNIQSFNEYFKNELSISDDISDLTLDSLTQIINTFTNNGITIDEVEQYLSKNISTDINIKRDFLRLSITSLMDIIHEFAGSNISFDMMIKAVTALESKNGEDYDMYFNDTKYGMIHANEEEDNYTDEEFIMKSFEVEFGDRVTTTTQRLKFANDLSKKTDLSKDLILKTISRK